MCQTYKAWTLAFLFNYPFFFFYKELRVRVRVMSQSHCHTSVTSDDIVTVIVTNYKVTKKSVKGFGKIMLYNIYYTWLFRVG